METRLSKSRTFMDLLMFLHQIETLQDEKHWKQPPSQKKSHPKDLTSTGPKNHFIRFGHASVGAIPRCRSFQDTARTSKAWRSGYQSWMEGVLSGVLSGEATDFSIENSPFYYYGWSQLGWLFPIYGKIKLMFQTRAHFILVDIPLQKWWCFDT